MSEKLKILHLEDMKSDAELVERALKKSDVSADVLVVDKKADFIKALSEFRPDVVLSDHSLPSFNSLEALTIFKKTGIKIPFILITGTVSEEFAVEAMKEGADDYILKDRLQRLPNAIANSLEKFRLENEREKFLQEIIASEALLREAEHMAQFGSWQIDLESGQSKWSEETYRIFGYTPGEIEPSLENFLKHIQQDDAKRVSSAIKIAIEHKSSRTMDFRIVNGNKSVRHIRSELRVQQNAEGKAFRVIGFNQDITEIKEAENEIKALNESLEKRVEERTAQLEEANRDLESFSYSVSHDLRTPLQVINGYASLLGKKYGDGLNEDGMQLLQGIKNYTRQMAHLMDDLLRFSRIGKTALEESQISMTELVKTIIDEYKKPEDTKTEIHLLDLKEAYCDPHLIQHVWGNLISNAIKYSSKKEHPLIEIGCEQKNGEMLYYVKDNGAGFDMAEADKLFGVFKRLHNEADFEGTGVGLALVHRVIEKHGGRIWADAKVNEGATFYFTLPSAN